MITTLARLMRFLFPIQVLIHDLIAVTIFVRFELFSLLIRVFINMLLAVINMSSLECKAIGFV